MHTHLAELVLNIFLPFCGACIWLVFKLVIYYWVQYLLRKLLWAVISSNSILAASFLRHMVLSGPHPTMLIKDSAFLGVRSWVIEAKARRTQAFVEGRALWRGWEVQPNSRALRRRACMLIGGSEEEAHAVPDDLRVREQAYVVVGVGSWEEEAFVTLDRGIVPRRRWFIRVFVHSAVNGFRRPGDNRDKNKRLDGC